MDFTISFITVLIALLYLVPGFLLKKFNLFDDNHLKSLSITLIYVFSPAMIISSFLNIEYSLETSIDLFKFFITTLVLQIILMAILYFIFKRKYEDSKYRILTIGSAFGNVGFFGMPLIRALLPGETIALCYSSMFVLSMNLLVFTFGTFCITNEKKYMSIRSAVLNPATISLFVAIPLYIFNVGFIMEIESAISLLGQMTTPICMIILGVRLATVNFRSLFANGFVYIICAMKLLVFPLLSYLLVYFLPFDYSFKASILILCATPCASIILNLAEIYQGDTDLSANTNLISTLLSIITIPIVLLIL